jgi:hypothetical protein
MVIQVAAGVKVGSLRTNMALEGLYGRFPIDVPDAMYRAL